jgi:hypothetical protein
MKKSGVVFEHNAGFFSCCSVRLDKICQFINENKKLPDYVDSSRTFGWYRNHLKGKDITFDYFKHYDEISLDDYNLEEYVDYKEYYQYEDYSNLNYDRIIPLVKKYFSLSNNIIKQYDYLNEDYKIDYDNTCVLLYRGNDKSTETNVGTHEDIIEKAHYVLSKNPDVKFLLQSDESEFIEKLSKEFPGKTFYFKGKIRTMTSRKNTVDRVIGSNGLFSKYYLAITYLMSKCKYIVCNTGNCSIWLMFYRGNCKNVYQLSRELEWLNHE